MPAGERSRIGISSLTAAALTAVVAGCSPPPRELAPLPVNPPGADARRVARENAEFATDLLRALSASDRRNLFFSPHSISTAMAMAWAGSRHQTDELIGRVMHWSGGQEATHDAFAALANQLAPSIDPATKETPYEWTSANRLWTSIAVLDGYNDRLIRSYASDARTLDFTDRQGAAKEINGWASTWTRGHIQTIVQPDDLEDVRLVLTNAVYFKGTWNDPFQSHATAEQPFHPAGGPTVQVPMMHDQRKVRYTRSQGRAAVSLPYRGGVSCLLILPDEGAMEQVVQTLSAGTFQELMSTMQPTQARLWIPRLSIKTRFSVNGAFESLGMGRAFSPSADFSGISSDEPLAISSVLHAATLDLDEVGTVATAVTAIGITATSAADPRETVEFKLDRPYLIAIVHDQTGEVLFLGRIGNPAEGS